MFRAGDAVGLSQGVASQSVTHLALHLRVNVLHVVHQVAGHHHAGLGMRGRQGLRLTQKGGSGRIVVGVRGDLGEVERQLRFPRCAPTVDHPGEELAVGAMGRDVALALIPNYPGDTERRDGVNHGVVSEARLMRPPRSRLDLCGRSPEVRVVFNDPTRRPDLGRSAAPVAVDEAHGHTQLFVESLAEEIPNGTEMHHFLGRTHHPAGRQVILRSLGGGLGNVEEPDHGVCGLRGLLLRLAQSLVARPLHVALAAANPHLADQHVLEHEFMTGLDPNGVGPTGLRGLDLGRPAPAVGSRSLPGVGGPTDRHRDGLRGSGPPPQGGIGALLQHHVRTNHRGQAHGGGERTGAQAQSSEEQDQSFHNEDRREDSKNHGEA